MVLLELKTDDVNEDSNDHLSDESQQFLESFLMGLLDQLPSNRHLQLLLYEAVQATNNAILHKELSKAFNLTGPEEQVFSSPRQKVGVFLEVDESWSDDSEISSGGDDNDSVASDSIGSD